ncbi:hypothetical protein BK139_14330 [Paenibacillus sp. FSL R5-0490]|nr:hypothetical protein BK139_14330 [Paenibacillus sp. FSL R5-0490]
MIMKKHRYHLFNKLVTNIFNKNVISPFRLSRTIHKFLIQLTAAAYVNKMKSSQIGGFCLLNLCLELVK